MKECKSERLKKIQFCETTEKIKKASRLREILSNDLTVPRNLKEPSGARGCAQKKIKILQIRELLNGSGGELFPTYMHTAKADPQSLYWTKWLERLKNISILGNITCPISKTVDWLIAERRMDRIHIFPKCLSYPLTLNYPLSDFPKICSFFKENCDRFTKIFVNFQTPEEILKSCEQKNNNV